MKKLQETEHLIFSTTGLLNYLGGNFTNDQLSEMKFGDVCDSILRNGGSISIGLSDSRVKHGRRFVKENLELRDIL